METDRLSISIRLSSDRFAKWIGNRSPSVCLLRCGLDRMQAGVNGHMSVYMHLPKKNNWRSDWVCLKKECECFKVFYCLFRIYSFFGVHNLDIGSL